MAKDTVRDEICAEVAGLFSEERKRRGISGNALASSAGLSQSLISSPETNPWNQTLDALLRIGDVGLPTSNARENVRDWKKVP